MRKKINQVWGRFSLNVLIILVSLLSAQIVYSCTPPPELDAFVVGDSGIEINWVPSIDCSAFNPDEFWIECTSFTAKIENITLGYFSSASTSSCSDDSLSLTNQLPGEYQISIATNYTERWRDITDTSNPDWSSPADEISDYSPPVSVIITTGEGDEGNLGSLDPSEKIDFDKYDIYYGDFNGDGVEGDIYFHGRDIFVLIGIDISIPIFIEGPTSFVLYKFSSSDTGYSFPAILDLDDSLLDPGSKLHLGVDFIKGEINGDGLYDLLIRGEATNDPSVVLFQKSVGAPELRRVSSTFNVSDRSNNVNLIDKNNDGRADLVLLDNSGEFTLDVVYTNDNSEFDVDYYVASNVSTMFDINTKSSNTIGSLGGSFRVSETGAATYTVPILTPSGTASVKPSVSLSYSSQSANGILGIGWNLNATSSISRCRQTLSADKKSLPITWTEQDRFCLDGQRLLVVNGAAYGSQNAIYKTEIDSGTIIKSHGWSNGEPNHFSVERKDGSITYYGLTDGLGSGSNSKQLLPPSSPSRSTDGRTVNWYQTRFEDNVGNPINYFYAQDNGSDFRLTRIAYAYGDNGPGGTTPNAEIYFDYDSRPDLIRGFLAGYELSTTLRLTKIRVNNRVNSEKQIRSYDIYYARDFRDATVRKRSVVAAIQQCAMNGSCQKETTFEWDIISGDFGQSTSINLHRNNGFVSDYKNIDINGDGVLDLVWATRWQNTAGFLNKSWDLEINYAISRNGVLQREAFTGGAPVLSFPDGLNDDIRLEPLDYNLDGRSDIALYRKRGNHWLVYLSVPSGEGGDEWKLTTNHIDLGISDQNAKFVDFNGDGLVDVVTTDKVHYLKPKANPSEQDYRSDQFYSFSPGETYQWQGFSHQYQSSVTFDSYVGVNRTDVSKAIRGVGDFNGDGLIDIIGSELKQTRVYGWDVCNESAEENLHVLIAKDGNFEVSKTLGSRSYSVQFPNPYLYDPFASPSDPKYDPTSPDYEPLAAPAEGNAYMCWSDIQANKNKEYFVRDINADGLSDIVIQTGSSVSVMLSNGNGFEPIKTVASVLSDGPQDKDVQLSFVDINFDGFLDIVEYRVSHATTGLRKVQLWNQSLQTYDSYQPTFVTKADIYSSIDINGDGLPDRVELTGETLKTIPFIPSTGKKDQITAITDGANNRTEITYKSISESGNHYQGLTISPNVTSSTQQCSTSANRVSKRCLTYHYYEAGDFYYALNKSYQVPEDKESLYDLSPQLEINGPLYVVTKVENSVSSSTLSDDITSAPQNFGAGSMTDSAGGTHTDTVAVSYLYGEAKIQAGGRGFLGFHSLTTIDEQSGIETTTLYRQDYPFIGRPESTFVYAPGGDELLKESHNIYKIKDFTTGLRTQAASLGTSSLGPLHLYTSVTYDLDYGFKVSGEWDSGNANYTGGQAVALTGTNFAVVNCLAGETDCPNFIGLAGNQKVVKQLITNSEFDEYGNATKVVARTLGEGIDQSITTNNWYQGSAITLRGSTYTAAELGRLSGSTVITNKNGVQTTNTSSFTYYLDSANGGFPGMLHTEEVVVSGTNEEKLSKELLRTHFYDVFGNKVEIAETGWNGSVVQERRSGVTVYDSTGRFVTTTNNALGHSLSTVVSRNDYGSATQVTGLNGSEKSFVLDNWNREVLQYTNTGEDKSTEYLACPNSGLNCPSNAITAVVVRSSISGSNIVSASYIDESGREIRSQSLGFDGKAVLVDTEYDKLGRKARVSEPYYASDVQNDHYWTRMYYDVFSNLIRTVAPNGSNTVYTLSSYESEVRNEKGHVKKEFKNALGELVRIEDPQSNQIQYRYSKDGELESILVDGGTTLSPGFSVNGLCRQPETNQEVINCYDELGRKISMWDPDKGHWQYSYNAFGELIEQIDGKGQRVINNYDTLGRVVSRTDYTDTNSIEGYTRWYYDSNTDNPLNGPVANALMNTVAIIYTEGAVSDVCTGTNYCSYPAYDDKGRLQSTVTQMPDGEIYETSQVYDANNRVKYSYDVLNGVVKRSGTAITSGIENHYHADFGYLEYVTDIDQGNELYRPQSINARGQITSVILNNKIEVDSQYYDDSGNIEATVAHVGATAIQENRYDWDKIGNLLYRHSLSGALGQNFDRKERFCYDNLNRLVKTHSGSITGTCSSDQSSWDQRYSINGNIEFKAGVGTYNYGAAGELKPHAVKSITGGVSRNYSYDANGNVENDGVRSFAYTTYDKPFRIDRGTYKSEFKYGPGRSRFYRKDTSAAGVEQTWYLGSVEKIIKPNNEVLWRRSLSGGALFEYQTSLSNEQIGDVKKHFLLKDHLGSTDIIVDENGVADSSQLGMSFNAWGKRRNVTTWVDLSASEGFGFDDSLTTKGFTGHEMLDGVGIIHMNGRVYDAEIGRFMQADPYVQSATDTQMFNRYSYARNNPLNRTDPSGYVWQFVAGAAIGWALGEVGKAGGEPGLVALGSVVSCLNTAGLGALGCGAGYSFGSTYSATGDLGKAVGAGALSGISSYAFSEIGGHFRGISEKRVSLAIGAFGEEGAGYFLKNYHNFGGNFLTTGEVLQQIGAHALIGGIRADIQGGKFAHGFVSAGVTKGATPITEIALEKGGFAGGLVANMVVGGSVSELTGGKFVNGAVTSAFQFKFNRCVGLYNSCNGRSEVKAPAQYNNGVLYTPSRHLYWFAEEICSFGQGACTKDNFISYYGPNYAAPGQTVPATEGAKNKLPFFGWFGWEYQPVIHEFSLINDPVSSPNNFFLRTANITLPGHIFDGRVDRYYYTTDSGISVLTVGRGGSGDFYPRNIANNIWGTQLFLDLNFSLRQQVINDSRK